MAAPSTQNDTNPGLPRATGARSPVSIAALGLVCAGTLMLGGCLFGGNKGKETPLDPDLAQGIPVPDLGRNGEPNTRAEIGVNAFLWRASLETLSFMPLVSVDPYGGVIIADWFTNPELPGERFKVSVFILDTRLRADALRVSLSKQVKTPDGWTDVAPANDAIIALEDAILTRARQLRIATVEANK